MPHLIPPNMVRILSVILTNLVLSILATGPFYIFRSQRHGSHRIAADQLLQQQRHLTRLSRVQDLQRPRVQPFPADLSRAELSRSGRIYVSGDLGPDDVGALGYAGTLADAIGSAVLVDSRGKLLENSAIFAFPDGGYKQTFRYDISTLGGYGQAKISSSKDRSQDASNGRTDASARKASAKSTEDVKRDALLCRPDAEYICEAALDDFSRVGSVVREFEIETALIGILGSSLETQHIGVCLSDACVRIAEVRPVIIYESKQDDRNQGDSGRYSCVYRQRRLSDGSVVLGGLPQSILSFRKHKLSKYEANFTSAVKPWTFTVDQPLMQWKARGYRGFVQNITAEEFAKLPRVDVSSQIVDNSRVTDGIEWEWVRDMNDEGIFASACASHASWTLHAAAFQGSQLDSSGLGLDDTARIGPFPEKVSFVEKALSVAAAVLGLSTMYIMLVNLFLRLTDENPSENFTISYFKLILFRWVVLATFVLALFLHGLETTPLGISWREEQTARNHRGIFSNIGLVATVAKETEQPSAASANGSVVVATVITGSAEYIRTDEHRLLVLLIFFPIAGVFAVIGSLILVVLWRKLNKPISLHPFHSDLSDENMPQTQQNPAEASTV